MRDLVLLLAILSIPVALVCFLWLLFATLGAMALLGAIITLDLVLLIVWGVIIYKHIKGN
jgi:heme/copper-type cytochrome/quinol oxidase subunit 4